MIASEHIIEKIELGKFSVTIYNRANLGRYPNHPIAVLHEKSTPKAKYQTSKVINHYVYKTVDEAKNFATRITALIQNDIDAKAARKAADNSTKAADFYKVGDVIVNTWGFEQTNVFFYQVVDVKNRTISIKEISQAEVEGSRYERACHCNVVPLVDNFLDNGDCFNLRVYAEGRLSDPETYYHMRKWDGTPQFKSWGY